MSIYIVEHPKDLPNEVIGKGGNITHAAIQGISREQNIAFSDVTILRL